MAIRREHTACPLDCPDICDLVVDIDDQSGKVIKVDGGQRSPLTDGFICGKVRRLPDYVYGADRVRYPMIRMAAKGRGDAPDQTFRRASWDEALNLVAEKIAAVRARSGGEAILPYHYGGSNGWLTEGGTVERFFRRLGASRCLRTLCAAATTAATRGLYGQMPGVALEDYADARLIVLWGVNPSTTGIHLVPLINRAVAAGAKLVVVDPRRTPLAKKADLHLAIRPGTDLPVALAVLSTLFERGLADDAFLTAHATGTPALARLAARWTLASAALEAGISVDDLERFVALYTGATPAVIRVGWGLERNRNGGSAVAAVLALPAVAGKFGVRGGGYTLSNGDARWGMSAEPGVAEPPAPTRGLNMSQLARVLTETRDPPVELLFVYNANPVVTAPHQNGVRAALAREDLFVVVHEQVMTETAALADVVLPATTFLEHREIRRGYGVMRLYDGRPVIAPEGEARSNTQLFADLLERLGLSRPGDPNSDDEIARRIFESGAPAVSARTAIDADGVASPPGGARPIPFVDVFPDTPDGKIHLVPESLDREASGGLYIYRPDPGTAAFPLALISPAIPQQISGTFGNLRKTIVPIEIHPEDARSRNIGHGDEVRIWNALGEVHTTAVLSTAVRPGVVSLPKGLWGHHTKNGRTANALIDESLADLGGQATFNDARVQVARRA
ncbi:MAG: molybdopterin-dependent oxidoreductase [Pseudomonadota bacterium]